MQAFSFMKLTPAAQSKLLESSGRHLGTQTNDLFCKGWQIVYFELGPKNIWYSVKIFNHFRIELGGQIPFNLTNTKLDAQYLPDSAPGWMAEPFPNIYWVRPCF